ncbi:MAG: flagellar hook protein FlgE [Armatimonadetes bacterium]|nr:flagellar hook protein FlgE [Armatimonadota bacterium]
MIQSLFSGISAMLANQTKMGVIGDNIANANTIGFKASRALFSETLSQTLYPATAATELEGGTGPSEVGQGVQVATIDPNYQQGVLLATGRAGDVAVDGAGFLVLTDGASLYYTRDGALGLDAGGNLIHLASGLRVAGLARDPVTGQVTGSPSAASGIQVPVGQLSLSRATSNVLLGGNLDAQTAEGGSLFSTFHVLDSLGVGHDVTVTFTRTATPGEWDVSASSPDGTVAVTGGSTRVTYDENGRPQVNTLGLELSLAQDGGATNPVVLTLDLSSTTQLGAETSLALRSQDGIAPGLLTGFTIDADGTVRGTFDNGLTTPLAALALAGFANPDGLVSQGGNVLAGGVNSGVAVFGTPGSAGLGLLRAGTLEGSNVDLATEFAEMIVTQRGFQASARVINVSDQMLQDLLTLAR